MNNIIKYSLCFFLLVALSGTGYAQPGQWTRKDSIKGPGKYGCVGFVVGSHGFLGTGYDNNDYKRSMYAYEPAQDDWDKVLSLGGETASGIGRNMAVAFAINGKGYIGTGQGSSSFYGDFWEYDAWNNTWQIVLGVGISARRAAVAFAIDTVAYIGTGYDATGLKEDFWKFDPSANTWTQVANYGGTARQKAVGIAMKGEGFVGLGDDGVLRDDFWKYNPGTNTWSPVQTFPGGARAGACGFAVDANMCVGTGQDYLDYKQDFWQYNYWTDSWTQIQNFGDTMGTARAYATAFAINGIGYVGAGYDGVAKDDFYAYEMIVGVDEVNTTTVDSKMYPNPIQKNSKIVLKSDVNPSDLTVMFYDLQGKVQTDKIRILSKHRSNGVLEIYLENQGLEAGQYLYSVQHTSNSITTGKFLVLE